MGAEATVGEAAQQAASPVGSEATGGESMAALFQGLRARNEEFLQAARAHQAHLSEAWERFCQRPRRAAGRDETQKVPRLLGTWAPAADPAAAPGAPGASQPGSVPPDSLQLALVEPSWQGSEFLRATLPGQEQVSLEAMRETSGHSADPVVFDDGPEDDMPRLTDSAASESEANRILMADVRAAARALDRRIAYAEIKEPPEARMRMAILLEELRARNEEFLQAACAQRSQMLAESEAWERICQRPGSASVRGLGAASGIEIQPKQKKPAKASPFAPGGRLASSSCDHYEPPRDNHATDVTQGELPKGSWV